MASTTENNLTREKSKPAGLTIGSGVNSGTGDCAITLQEMGLGSFENAFKREGWTEPRLFHIMSDQDLQECGLRTGHIARFREAYPQRNFVEPSAPPNYDDL